MPLAPRTVEPATDGEDRIADLLGREPAALEADMENSPVGGRGIRASRLLLPDGAEKDLAVDRLDRPATADEVGGEPVEQFRMRRGAAADAEVVGRGDEAAAEVMLPDPVDHHPRREWMARTGEPLGELEPAAPRGGGRERGVAEHRDKSPRHLLARLIGLAATLDAGIGRSPLGHRVGHRHRAFGEEPAQLGSERIGTGFEGGNGALQRRDLLDAASRRRGHLGRKVEGAMGRGGD